MILIMQICQGLAEGLAGILRLLMIIAGGLLLLLYLFVGMAGGFHDSREAAEGGRIGCLLSLVLLVGGGILFNIGNTC